MGARRGWRRSGGGFLWRLFRLALSGVVLFACVVAFLCWLTLPPSSTTLRIAGLSAPVAITIDSYGIPRIKAASEADAASALGYLHARDRMFQMDLMRRAASGRLSELAGARALPLDRMSRTLGEMQHAERAYNGLPGETRALLVAYTAGVNAWIAQRGRFAAPEFLVLGAPQPWRPVECLLWSETVALWLSDNFRTELANFALAGKVPADKIRQLWPPQADTPAPDSSGTQRQGFLAHPLGHLPGFPDPFTWPSQASNAWAVDGRHSDTAAPLLAGDPHLALQFPSIWYLARIETPANTLVGATAPGVPFVIIGRNAHIAWTFTSAGIDTQDLFIETALPGGMYATPSGPRPFEIRQERIHVRGAADDVLTVRTTRHGPVISDLIGARDGPVLAVEMAEFDRTDSAAPGILALDRATNVTEAGVAAKLIVAPVQNLTVADHQDIALFTTGYVPVRAGGDSTAPVSGGDGVHDWTGFVAGDTLPHFVSPPNGVLVNANERTVPADFPVFLGADWPAPWRARRIHQMLNAKPIQSIDDFQAMQADDVSVFAHDLLPSFAALPRQAGAVGQAQALLAQWDGAMATTLPQPLIFNAAIQLFVSQVLRANHVPEKDSGPWAGFAAWLMTPAGGAWCGGDCRPALSLALRDSVAGLAATYGPDPSAWRWGEAHRAIFAHPLLGNLPVIGLLASRHVAVPGDDTTLFRGGNGVLGDFAAVHGAAYRGDYDLAAPDRSRFIVTPGQSGNLFSPHAWDLLKFWARGSTVAIPPAPDRVDQTVTLLP